MTKLSTSFKITNFQLLGAVILVLVESMEVPGKVKLLINKLRFEDFITNGTGRYDATFSAPDYSNQQRDTIILCPVDEYWDETPVAIRSDLYSYVASDEGLKEYIIQQLIDKSNKFDLAFEICRLQVESCIVREQLQIAETLVTAFSKNFQSHHHIELYNIRLQNLLQLKRLEIAQLEARPANLYVSIFFHKRQLPQYS